jgi:RNA polymerase sigma-70 factor, ECF subfamily
MGTIVRVFGDTQEPTVYGRQEEIRQLTNVIASHRPSLTRIALRLVGNAADAEDAVQDAFLSAYTHLDQFKRQAQMSTWLTTIVINAARMKVRRRPRQVHIPLDQQDGEQDYHPLSETLSDRQAPKIYVERGNLRNGWRRCPHSSLLLCVGRFNSAGWMA